MSFLSWLSGGAAKTGRSVISPDDLDLDSPLLYLSPRDPWTVRDSFEGVAVYGATGSGKTTGSGVTLAKAFLAHNYGGLVICIKRDDCALWQRYARETGRSDSLLIVSPSQPWRFNFVDFESRRPGRGASLTENLVRLLAEAMEVAERRTGEREDYWTRAGQQLLRNSVDLVLMAQDRVTLPDIHEVIVSAPTEPEQLRSRDFQERSLCLRYLEQAERLPKSPERQNDWKMTANYWLQEFPNLSSRTRSCIFSTVTTLLDPLLRGVMRTLFATTTNFVPEVIHQGAVVILDVPVHEFGQVGAIAQVLFKYIWQRATERREFGPHDVPVFLWADEAQHVVTRHDALFQSTARSARVATVYLSQNLPSYYAAIGGGHCGQAAVQSLMGNLTTKIFHSNSCPQTNLWASETIARNWQFRGNAGTSTSDDAAGDPRVSRSVGGSDSLDFQVEPHQFTLLRKGGPQNNGCVDAIIVQSGRIWYESRQNHLKVCFKQS